MTLQVLPLNGILESSISAYYSVLKQNHIVPEISIPDQQITGRVNENALSRVLGNILSNAVKYSDGDLKIVLSEDGDIRISNHASGLSEVQAERLFDRFYTVNTARKSTGLGLSIAKALMEKMGGTISFESKEGTGTTFVIRIPFQIDADMKDRNETEEKTETSIQGLHVLLTEDNELNMEIAEFVLQNEGAVVTKAWNGQKAVDIFRKSRPGEFDAILMDIMMPVMNGYEAAKMIRSLDREDAKVIPIIAMTANAFTEDKMRAKEAGMDEHIAKPVDGKLLVKVINELVKRNQREKL